jgi:hypothetical protein
MTREKVHKNCYFYDFKYSIFLGNVLLQYIKCIFTFVYAWLFYDYFCTGPLKGYISVRIRLYRAIEILHCNQLGCTGHRKNTLP